MNDSRERTLVMLLEDKRLHIFLNVSKLQLFTIQQPVASCYLWSSTALQLLLDKKMGGGEIGEGSDVGGIRTAVSHIPKHEP